MSGQTIQGRVLVDGHADGPVLFCDTGLSFWGGVDPTSGRVIDSHHPLHSETLDGKILAIPAGRGSCTGSAVLLETIANGCAPRGIILATPDEVLTLGALISETLFDGGVPVSCLSRTDFERLRAAKTIQIERGGRITIDGTADLGGPAPLSNGQDHEHLQMHGLELTAQDDAMLNGSDGEAVAIAMRIVCRMAEIAGARRLIDVTRVHIDGCIYTGPASLAFARRFADLGARVRVPTTLNAISVDRRGWREQGIDAEFGSNADALAEAYVTMGAAPTYTCAPYLSADRPAFGEQIGWAESNAVVYANSVLGARTMKYPDFLDLCIALTGRAPEAGCHLPQHRKATLEIAVDAGTATEEFSDMFWPLLGHLVGRLAPDEIPVLTGLAASAPDLDALKAFGAAFATTSAAPMFHIVGITPEATDITAVVAPAASIPRLPVSPADLSDELASLNARAVGPIDLVALGNPHLSLSEIEKLAALCAGRRRHERVSVIVTCSRAILSDATDAGLVAPLEAFGVQFVTDTCWCMITAPLVPVTCRAILTNSGKYVHYGPGLTGYPVGLASLANCVEAAVSGQFEPLPRTR